MIDRLFRFLMCLLVGHAPVPRAKLFMTSTTCGYYRTFTECSRCEGELKDDA